MINVHYIQISKMSQWNPLSCTITLFFLNWVYSYVFNFWDNSDLTELPFLHS
jgi:hypothetical protein